MVLDPLEQAHVDIMTLTLEEGPYPSLSTFALPVQSFENTDTKNYKDITTP